MTHRIRPAQLQDIEYLAPLARQADTDELWAGDHLTPREAMTQGMHISDCVWVVEIAGNPVCMFGVAEHFFVKDRYVGVSWMIGTTEIEKHKTAFFRASKEGISMMLDMFPILCNFVDARHIKAIQWLKRLGARFKEPSPYGRDHLPFLFFEIRR